MIDTEKVFSQTNINVKNLSLTNVDLHTKKDNTKLHANKLQCIVNNWAHSHHKLKKIIINAQIPDQCMQILGGNIDEAVKVYKQIETESVFSTLSDLEDDFKSRFVSNTHINQTLKDKHCITNPDGLAICTTRLIALDPTIRNPSFDIPTLTTEMHLKFTISNG